MAFPLTKIFAICSLILALALASFSRNGIYRCESDVWMDIMMKSPQKGRAFNALGAHYYSRGDFDKAVQMFAESVRRHPFYPQLYVDLAQAYERTGKLDQARATMQTALLITDIAGITQPVYRIYLGDLYFKELLLTDALREYRIAERIDPGNNSVIVKIGRVHYAQGEYEKARTYFEKACANDPDNINIREDLKNVSVVAAKQHK